MVQWWSFFYCKLPTLHYDPFPQKIATTAHDLYAFSCIAVVVGALIFFSHYHRLVAFAHQLSFKMLQKRFYSLLHRNFWYETKWIYTRLNEREKKGAKSFLFSFFFHSSLSLSDPTDALNGKVANILRKHKQNKEIENWKKWDRALSLFGKRWERDGERKSVKWSDLFVNYL